MIHYAKSRGLLISLALLIVTACGPESAIQQIESFDEIQQKIDQVDTSTLVVFDCDETILIPTEPYLFTALQANPIVQKIDKEFVRYAATQPDPIDYSNAINAEIYLTTGYEPVEQSMIHSINKLCSRGVKVIALTAQETGAMFGGRIARFEAWRYERLKKLGIDLSHSFVEQDIRFDSFPPLARGKPVFYKGILCSSSYPKGEVLTAFLDCIGYAPSRVIFIDDSPENVCSVADAMKKRGISFQGYIYRAADYKVPAVDEKVLQVQLNYIKKHNHVITYQAAQKLLQTTFAPRSS